MTGINGGYDLDPRRLGSAGATLLGRVLGADDGTLALADDAEKLLAAADQSYAAFIEAADKLAATPAMRSDLGPADPSAAAADPVDDIRTLNLARGKHRHDHLVERIWL